MAHAASKEGRESWAEDVPRTVRKSRFDDTNERHKKTLQTNAKAWQVLALATGRCLHSAAMMFVMYASGELLQRIFKGNQARTQRVISLTDTVNMLLSFSLGPLAGALMDSYGRKPFLVGAPAIIAAFRLYISRFPSVKTFIGYRLTCMLAAMPFMPAFQAASADVLGVGTHEYTLTVQRMESAAMAVTVAGLFGAGKMSNPRTSLLISAGFSAAASMCFAVGLSETLKAEDRRPVPWSRLRNPIGSLQFFGRSPLLKRLGALHVLMTIPLCNTTLDMLRRKRFGWGMQEMSRQMMWVMIFGLFASQTAAPLLRYLGIQKTMQVDNAVGGAGMLVNSLVSDERLVRISAMQMCLRHGPLALDRALTKEAQRIGAGQGEKAAAVANLTVLPSLIAPTAFSEIFARTVDTKPEMACLISAAFFLANSAIGIPMLACEGENRDHKLTS